MLMNITVPSFVTDYMQSALAEELGVDTAEGAIKSAVRSYMQEAIQAALEVLKEFALEAAFSIALVGGGICIILKVAGWKDGNRWAGILFVANILMRFLLGG